MPSCPDCKLQCPPAVQCPEPKPAAAVAALHRRSMLERQMKNILECAPGQDCRLNAQNRFKVIGQKGITLWMRGLQLVSYTYLYAYVSGKAAR